MSRKGLMADWLAAFATILLIIVAVLWLSAKNLELGRDYSYPHLLHQNNHNADNRLIDYLHLELKEDTDSDGSPEKILMKDLLIISYFNEDFTLVEDTTRNYFATIKRNRKSGWNLELQEYSAEGATPVHEILTDLPSKLETETGAFDTATTTGAAEAYLPIPGTDQQLKLRLFEREFS